ncbi:MAG: MerR family transcriptional regulator [Deltaproteobacteria bacterium]|nr:MerR family transcriptional regulator [Deltaproteobacteria bacterium]
MSESIPAIPDKLYFKIGEVSQIARVEPYVLRYWESEFSMMRPTRSRARQRLYHRRDVELILEIKRLLYEEKFTISGAKKKLLESRRTQAEKGTGQPADSHQAILQHIRKELQEIRKILS